MTKPTCTASQCDSPVAVRGYCNKHYLKFRKYGDPLGARPIIPASVRLWRYVEKTPTCWNWTGAKRSGYGILTVDKSTRNAHRISYELLVGPIPEGVMLDHVCHNKACVNPAHLRPATNKQNLENLTGSRVDSQSGIRGVWWAPDRKRWRAKVLHNGKAHNVGSFVTREQAEAAVINKRNELFTHNDLDRKTA